MSPRITTETDRDLPKDAKHPGLRARTARRPTLVPQRSCKPDDDPFSERVSDVVKSSARVLDPLEFFRENRQPARATEVRRALGLPNSSVDKILKTLVRKGYLIFDPASKRYSPAYRIVRTVSGIKAAFYGGPCACVCRTTAGSRTLRPCLASDTCHRYTAREFAPRSWARLPATRCSPRASAR